MTQLRLEVTHRLDFQPLGSFRKPEQAKEVGAVGVLFRNVHVTDEQFVQARPKDKHDSSDEIHINGFNQHEDDLGIASHAVLDERVHHKNAALEEAEDGSRERSSDGKEGHEAAGVDGLLDPRL